MIPVWARMALLLAVLAALLAAVRIYQRRFSPQPELPRKAVHIIMGLVTLSFPWVFSQRWPVVVLGVIATGGMVALRVVGPLRRGVGDVLHAVDRESLGEICFPISVTIVWWLSYGEPLLFVIPVLMLTLADAAAAIVGLRYGRRPYTTAESPKTVEGSAATFAVAFAAVVFPLLAFTAIDAVTVLLMGTLLGLLVMLFEAIAWRGLDNLFIPLGAYVFLNAQIDESAAWLAGQLIALVALMAIGMWYRQRTTLVDNGALAAALAGYVFWVLGGWRWIVAPVTLFLVYAVVTPFAVTERGRVSDTRAVVGYGAAGLWWVFLAYSTDRPELLYAFTASFAAHLAMFAAARAHARDPHWLPTLAFLPVLMVAWLLMFGPWLLIAGVSVLTVLLAGVGLLVTVAAALAIHAVQQATHDRLSDEKRWFAQAVIAFAVSWLAAFTMGVMML